MTRHDELIEPGPVLALLQDLASTLTGLGVTCVPQLDAFAVRSLTVPGVPAPQVPASLLDADDDELGDYVRDKALHEALNAPAGSGFGPSVVEVVRSAVVSGMCQELAGLIREHADAIVGELRPIFTQAADKAREVAGFGIAATDSAEVIIENEPEVVAVWRDFRDNYAGVLDQISDARINMTRVARVAPVRPAWDTSPGGRDYGPLFGVRELDRPGEASWQRWVRLSADLALPAPSTFGPLDSLPAHTLDAVRAHVAIEEARP